MNILAQRVRDERDLKVLELLDAGLSQQAVADRLGITRGPIVKLVTDIRKDEEAQP
ncbi:winged helix-turn-helix domain-containing protein [Shimia sp. R9_2]|uniref:winged helix-turn-helix domain-containing protein n=1 Tax=Shimia sp. R9_2 TaxID=2821112 RepID=UPI001ADA4A18|nr:winged helix-turn-helix domain-containing protein [Shimia sp. R9_2]MBO9398755.1 winged helix-turn-helix domain-containing protein [Shimia sp. R9_2]